MFWDLLSEKNNLQLQISDFEDEESIKVLETINKSFKSKTKHLKTGFCKRCGSYHLIGWGGYGRKVRHMYVESESVRARRFRCKQCGKCFSSGVGNFFRTLMFYKNFHYYSSGPNKDQNIMLSMGINSESMFDFIKLP